MIWVLIVFLVIYFVACAVLIGVILLQEGKGGGLSGMGSSTIGDTFGHSGAATAIRRWTRNFAIIFVVGTMVLTFVGERVAKSQFGSALTEGLPTAPAGQPMAPGAMPPGAAPAEAPGRAGAPPAGATGRPVRVAPRGAVPANPAGAPAAAPAGQTK